VRLGLTEFFHMGGYAAYVWPAFGFAGVVLLALAMQSWRAARRRQDELEQLRRLVRPGAAERLRPTRPATPAGGAVTTGPGAAPNQ
jgi:heme exporter protein D